VSYYHDHNIGDVLGLRPILSKIESDLSSLSSTVSSLDLKVSSQSEEIEKLDKEVSRVRSQMSKLRSEMEGLRKLVQEAFEEIRRLMRAFGETLSKLSEDAKRMYDSLVKNIEDNMKIVEERFSQVLRDVTNAREVLKKEHEDLRQNQKFIGNVQKRVVSGLDQHTSMVKEEFEREREEHSNLNASLQQMSSSVSQEHMLIRQTQKVLEMEMNNDWMEFQTSLRVAISQIMDLLNAFDMQKIKEEFLAEEG